MSESDDYSRFVRPAADEELHQSPPAAVAMGTSPEDGLPMMVALPNLDKSPPLTEETLVCVADKRSFVVRTPQDGNVLVSFKPDEVTTLPNGSYVVSTEEFMARVNLTFPSRAIVGDDETHYSSIGDLTNYIERIDVCVGPELRRVVVVEPVRPQCYHYLRMQTDLAADRDARFYVRACMSQRDSEGEYYSVRDTLISACSLRSPRHIASEQVLDDFDQSKIAAARAREQMEEFDVDQELANQKPGALGVLGG